MKSAFVSLYLMAVTVITAIAGRSLWFTQDYLTWGGVLLVSAPFLGVITWLMVFRNVARTSARFPTLIGLATAGVALASWGYVRGGSPLAPLLAIVAWAGFMLYSYWYSSLKRQCNGQLTIGNSLPNFELTDVAGNKVSSSSFNDKPTIWIFYRGNWCPLCMAQIKELVAQYKELKSYGVRTALISSQPHGKTVALAKRFDAPFDFLTDEGNSAARALGIDHPGGLPMGMEVLGYDSDTVLPTVIISDTGGRILWVHETDNYRVRPEPGNYLAVLRDKGVIAGADRPLATEGGIR
jgi:peroxiredoxin